MTSSMNELMSRGMECLTETLGVVEAERFISLVIQERFDYTKWQREYFDKMPPGAFHAQALAYGKDHPYTGPADRL
jgi:hypothetical protein